jgi:regulator of sigma E protease
MSFFLAAVGFMALIVLHELGHFTAAKAVGMRVERFALFFPPLLLRKKRGETEYALGVVPLGGYVKISGMNPDEDLPDEVRTRAYYAQPVWKRVVVIAAGPLVNLVLALVLLVVFFWLIGGQTSAPDVERTTPGFPAAEALEPGDRLIAVNGREGEPAELSQEISEQTCRREPPADGCSASSPVALTVERDGAPLTVWLTPVYDADLRQMRVGFEFAEGPRETLPFGEAVSVSLDRFWFVAQRTVEIPLYVIDPERRDEISGVVGSYEVTRLTIQDNLANAVSILALISLSLAIINLFPFLPLDGGHIFWAVVEKIRRKPVSYATMERAGIIGFMLLIPLIVIGLTNDLGRIFGEGFNIP